MDLTLKQYIKWRNVLHSIAVSGYEDSEKATENFCKAFYAVITSDWEDEPQKFFSSAEINKRRINNMISEKVKENLCNALYDVAVEAYGENTNAKDEEYINDYVVNMVNEIIDYITLHFSE